MDDLASLCATQPSSVSFGRLMACVLVALGLGLALAGAHAFRNRHTRSLSVTLALLPAIVCVVIAMVNGNLGAGVAVAGAFSLVRFRSAPGSARDICFVFLAMAVGLVCGMGYLALACAVTAVVGGACLLLERVGFDGFSRGVALSLRVSVPVDAGDVSAPLEAALDAHAASHRLVSMKGGGPEAACRLTYDLVVADERAARSLADDLRRLGTGVEVSLSRQAASSDAL